MRPRSGATDFGMGALFMKPKDVVAATVFSIVGIFAVLMYRQKEAMKSNSRSTAAMVLNEFYRDRTQPLVFYRPKKHNGFSNAGAAAGAAAVVEEEDDSNEAVSYASLHAELMSKGMGYIPKDPYKRQLLIEYALWLGKLNHFDRRTITKKAQVTNFAQYTNVLVTNLFIMDTLLWDHPRLRDFFLFSQKMTALQHYTERRVPGYEEARNFMNEFHQAFDECEEFADKQHSKRINDYAYGDPLISIETEYQVVCPSVKRLLARIQDQHNRPEPQPKEREPFREPQQF